MESNSDIPIYHMILEYYLCIPRDTARELKIAALGYTPRREIAE